MIAKRLLPAKASNAAIARLVSEIWRLNAKRIGTGNPNMIDAGAVLRLPS